MIWTFLWLRSILCICLMNRNVRCKTQGISVLLEKDSISQNYSSMLQEQTVLNFHFLSMEIGERKKKKKRGNAEYQTCRFFYYYFFFHPWLFDLNIVNIVVMNHWATELKGHYFNKKNFSLRSGKRNTYVRHKTPEISTALICFPQGLEVSLGCNNPPEIHKSQVISQ